MDNIVSYKFSISKNIHFLIEEVEMHTIVSIVKLSGGWRLAVESPSQPLWGDHMGLRQKVCGICIVAVGSIGGLIGTAQALQDIAHQIAVGAHE